MNFQVRGVVKNGHVVLAQALDVPDGTEIVVSTPDFDEDAPVGPSLIMTDEEFQEFTEYFTGKKGREGFEEFHSRVQAAQVGRGLERRAS